MLREQITLASPNVLLLEQQLEPLRILGIGFDDADGAGLCDAAARFPHDDGDASGRPYARPAVQFAGQLVQADMQLTAARREGLPISLAVVDGQRCPAWKWLDWMRRAAGEDPDLQFAVATPPGGSLGLAEIGSERRGELESTLQSLASRIVPLGLPLGGSETQLGLLAAIDRWRNRRQRRLLLEHQSEYMADSRRVMQIIQACNAELEESHESLRSRTGQLFDQLQQQTQETQGTRDVTVLALAHLADSRDPETGEHLMRMRAYSQILAVNLGKLTPFRKDITPEFLDDFYRSTPLHDIGKVGIPDEILLKPGRLTPEEFEVMKRHTTIGAEALEKTAASSNFGAFLALAADIARHHHEKYNGQGYPHGLAGQDIPLSARIVAVADVFDALSSPRVYKSAMPPQDALDLMARDRGTHFDPLIFDAFVACFDEVLAARSQINAA